MKRFFIKDSVKKILVMVLSLAVLMGVIGPHNVRGDDGLPFINIDLSGTDNPNDFPFGIECGDPEFVYVTIYNQGLLARINKNTRAVEALIDNPDSDTVGPGQNFFAIARDPNTGNMYINENTNGKLWRFNPSAPPESAWTRIPLVERIVDSAPPDDVEYPAPFTYEVTPDKVTVGGTPYEFTINSFGGVVYANNNIWVALDYTVNFEPNPPGVADASFVGLAKVDPYTLSVERIPISGASLPTGLAVDVDNPAIIWVTDKPADKVYKFDTTTGTVLQTITDPLIDSPRGIDNDETFVYVARDLATGDTSTIARINKATLEVTLIDTEAPIDVDNFGSGTFTVFVNNGLLVWTDRSKHVGTIDLVTSEKITFDTEFSDENHFGCVANNGEFWFAGHGSAKVGILPNSKFSVGGSKNPNRGGGGRREGEDTVAPTIEGHYWDPEDPTSGQNVTINANIMDNSSVESAIVFYYSDGEDPREAHSVSMNKINEQWFKGDMSESYVKEPKMSFWIVATDSSGNSAKTDVITLDVRKGQSAPQARTSVSNLPAHVLESIKPKTESQVEKLEVFSTTGGNSIKAYPDNIVLRNAGNVPISNIRVVLSPQIAKSFLISEQAIKSIEPNTSVAVTFSINGNPNRDTLGGLTAYSGEVVVTAEHHSPVIIPVNIGGNEGNLITDYMAKVASIAELRYGKLSLLNSMLAKNVKTVQNYDVVTGYGQKVITNPAGELVIKNLGSKVLKNVRLYLSNAGHAFILDQNNIQYLEPNGEVTIRMIPMMDTDKYSKDIVGELLVVPSNDIPVQIPINIAGAERMDSADEYRIMTISGTNDITTADSTIIIKNDGGRQMDSVKISLSNNLERIFSLSEKTFKHIQTDSHVAVKLKYEAGDLKTFMQDYEGELLIMSEHHNMQKMPINIEWKKLESKHFTVYVRSGYENVAKQITHSLEEIYENTATRFGVIDTKTVIYVTSNMEEMKTVSASGKPFYSYADDIILICACDEPQQNAAKQFLYRLIIDKYTSYYNMKALTFDEENWLIDGVAGYLADEMSDTGMTWHIVVPSGTGFMWHGPGSDVQYEATYGFFRFLEDKYGQDVIDRVLYHLSSGMISNTKCSAIEECAVLHAVYDMKGMDMDNKRYSFSFNDLAEEWRCHVADDNGYSEIAIRYGPTPRNVYAYHME